ncbi:MAG: carbohydrate ABC transporter permease [Lachnospiraceae bacterium]
MRLKEKEQTAVLKPKKKKRTREDVVIDSVNYILLIALAIVCFYPFWYILCAAFSDNSRMQAFKGILLLPQGFDVGAFKLAFSHPLLLSGYKNILIILAIALPLNIIMTVFCAYFMASKDMMWKKVLIPLFMFTMFFGGGLIPSYLNQRDLGLYNNLWALIIPGCLSLYNAIICKTAIETIPDSLVESAYIDGANDLTILFRIILPLIKPTLAVLVLYYGVGHWNSWFPASIYIKDNSLLPLQSVLRSILVENSDILNATSAAAGDVQVDSFAETIKYAAIIISTVPILIIYPLVQKHFTKGVMIGAVKG